MKHFKFISVKILLVAFLASATMQSGLAQIYKTVDKDGNVSFTDTAPKDGSKPVELPPISVIETPEYQVKAKQVDENGEQQKSLRTLRSEYRDFAITSPTPEDSVWAPEENVTVSWSTGKPLLKGMRVKVAIDGKEQPPATSNLVAVPPLDRGEHTAAATLVDADGRVIAKAETVTFYVRQPNLYTNPNRVRPRG